MISYQQQQHYWNGAGKTMTTVAYVDNQKQETIYFGAKAKHENNG